MLTRITDRNILWVYINVDQIIKNRGPGPYNSLRHADNRKYFSGLYREIKGKRTCFSWREKWEKFGDVLAEKKVTLSWLMNSDVVKPEIWTSPLSLSLYSTFKTAIFSRFLMVAIAMTNVMNEVYNGGFAPEFSLSMLKETIAIVRDYANEKSV